MNTNGSNKSRRAVGAAIVAALATAAVGGQAAVASHNTGKKPAAVKTATKTKAKAKSVAKSKAKVGTAGSPGHGPRGGHGPSAAERAAFASALATKLGVSVDSVTAALEALKPAPGARPDRAAFPAALAAKLGLDTATVKAALDAVHPDGPEHGPDHGDR